MTSKCELIDSQAWHVTELLKTLRDKDRREAEALGLDPEYGLWYAFRNSPIRRTAIINDRVSAMWGTYGTIGHGTGIPYLVTGKGLEELSAIRFIKLYKQEVQDMLKVFPVLENYVHAEYTESVKTLKLAGFTLTGPFKADNGEQFLKFSIVK